MNHWYWILTGVSNVPHVVWPIVQGKELPQCCFQQVVESDLKRLVGVCGEDNNSTLCWRWCTAGVLGLICSDGKFEGTWNALGVPDEVCVWKRSLAEVRWLKGAVTAGHCKHYTGYWKHYTGYWKHPGYCKHYTGYCKHRVLHSTFWSAFCHSRSLRTNEEEEAIQLDILTGIAVIKIIIWNSWPALMSFLFF